MGLATLPGHSLELRADRTHQTAVIIGYDKVDTTEFTQFEALK